VHLWLIQRLYKKANFIGRGSRSLDILLEVFLEFVVMLDVEVQ
jgi:hypothetical protein